MLFKPPLYGLQLLREGQLAGGQPTCRVRQRCLIKEECQRFGLAYRANCGRWDDLSPTHKPARMASGEPVQDEYLRGCPVIARAWVTRDIEAPFAPALRCNFHTRVIVPGDRTPSGQRYDFQPEEVKDDILREDMNYLLGLTYQQSACCGGNPGEPINYFVLV